MNEIPEIPPTSVNIQEAEAFQKIIAGLIDGFIVLIVFSSTISYLIETYPSSNFQFKYPSLPILFILGLYRFCSLYFFNNTLGMMISKIRLLNQKLERLSIKEKICAGFFILLPGVDYYRKI